MLYSTSGLPYVRPPKSSSFISCRKMGQLIRLIFRRSSVKWRRVNCCSALKFAACMKELQTKAGEVYVKSCDAKHKDTVSPLAEQKITSRLLKR